LLREGPGPTQRRLRLKRMVIGVTAIAALVLAAAALANVKHFTGPITECGKSNCGRVDLDVKFKHGRAKSVDNFIVDHWLTHCDAGDTRITNSPSGGFGPMEVHHRHFSDDFGTVQQTHITGTVAKSKEKVRGSVEFDGPIGTEGNCHAGPDKYKAHVTH
jgi:hypothetical protein